jgi:hypothetical protein
MRREGANVSHLTPAMGQILIGHASNSIPSLKRVFFVGDLLLKRDCGKLQEIAPNVFIVNMYGTVRTPRSHHSLCSRSLLSCAKATSPKGGLLLQVVVRLDIAVRLKGQTSRLDPTTLNNEHYANCTSVFRPKLREVSVIMNYLVNRQILLFWIRCPMSYQPGREWLMSNCLL